MLWKIAVVLVWLLSLPLVSHAQLWNGYLSSTRGSDWQGSVYIPPDTTSWTQCGSTIAAGASQATIQAAINACGTSTDGQNQYVKLGAGTFTITGAVTISKKNFVLRGSGANATTLNGSGSGCAIGQSVICVVTGNPGNYYYEGGGAAVPPGGGLTAVTAGATRGSTSITVADATGIQVGDLIFVRQVNGNSSNPLIPGTNNESLSLPQIQCSFNYPSGHSCLTEPNRLIVQPSIVTAKVGNVLTLQSPLYYSGWSQSASPEVWYYTGSAEPAGNAISNVGVEDMKITPTWTAFTSGGPISYGSVQFYRVNGAWAKGLAINGCDSGCIMSKESTKVAFFNNYLYNSRGADTSVVSSLYGFYFDLITDIAIYNNIIQKIQAPFLGNVAAHNAVIAYNFVRNNVASSFPNGFPLPPIEHPYNWYGVWPIHGPGVTNTLIEGNDTNGVITEIEHGSGCCTTIVRNLLSGREANTGVLPYRFTNAYNGQTYSGRMTNILGNVMGTAGWHNNYESSAGPHGQFGVSTGGGNAGESSIFMLGSWGSEGNNYDAFVESTLLRWGNYDTVTGNERYCGTSANTGWTTRCGSATEIPAGHAVPATETVPTSFVFASKPSWFGSTIPWPPIGAGVSGGNVTGYGGRVNKIPARVCAENAGMSADGTSSMFTFDPVTCYGAGGGGGSPATATITSPSSGTNQTAGTVFAVSGTATAGSGSLNDARVYIDGALACQDTTTPWSPWTCNVTAPTTPGTYTLTAKAGDAGGLGTASSGVTFTVPASTASATITSPSNGSTQTASIAFTVSGTATASAGSLTAVSVYINGVLACTDSVSPFTSWSCSVTAPSIASTYTLTAKATDAAGQGPASSGVNFIVPSSGSTVQKRWGKIKR